MSFCKRTLQDGLSNNFLKSEINCFWQLEFHSRKSNISKQNKIKQKRNFNKLWFCIFLIFSSSLINHKRKWSLKETIKNPQMLNKNLIMFIPQNPNWRENHFKYTLFFIRTSNILPSFNVLIFLFFSSFWTVLVHSCSNKLQFVYLTITSDLACWKSRKFPISEGKKEILNNFDKYKSIVYNKLMIDLKLVCS